MINLSSIKNLDPSNRLELAIEYGFFVGNSDLTDAEWDALNAYYHHCFEKKVPYISIGDNEDGHGWILVNCPDIIDSRFLLDCENVLSTFGGNIVKEGCGGISSLITLNSIPFALNSILVFQAARKHLSDFNPKQIQFVN